MLQAFVITLREGLEAFLIIAISLAYLRKSGRRELISAVHWGIGLSVLLSIGAAYLFQQASNQALWEGVLAIAAAVSVATLTVHMWRTAKKIKSEIEGHLRTSAEKTGNAAWMGVFLFTLLMISREGMETALLMGTLLTQVQAMTIVGGAIAGTLASAAIAMLWSRYGHRVNLSLFFQVTAIFLFVFVIQLVVRGVHEMSEQAMLPYSAYLHDMTESWGPDSTFGHLLTYLLVLLPLAWLTLKSAFFTRPITVPRMPESREAGSTSKS